MIAKNFFCSIQNLKIKQPESNQLGENYKIASISPTKSQNLSQAKPKAYTNKKIKLVPFFTYKGFSSPNNRYSNIYKTIFNKTGLNKSKKLKQIFPKISLSLDKIKYNKTNKSENNDNTLYSSIFKMIKTSQNKYNIKKDNLFFMKEKKSEIQKIHKDIMKNNQLHIISTQKDELINNLDNTYNNKEINNKLSCISLTEENKVNFEKEYKNICKNKLKAKYLIEKEIDNIGRRLSWVNKFSKKELKIGETYNNEKDKENNRIKNNLLNSIILKRMKGKDPVLEINQTSNFPIIAVDKKLISNLWKKDMIKYCKYTLDIEKPKDKRFLSNLLDVYD